MHARRYFVKALDAGDKRAALPLAAFKKLYEIEAKTRDASAGQRLRARRAESAPLYDELESWCRTYRPNEPPSSALGRALGYQLNNVRALRRFLDDERIPIDNGIVERLHVRTALTRKNYLFAGSDAGAERAAIAYTLLGSCQLAGVEPVAYLADVLPRLAKGLRGIDARSMLPAYWLAARKAATAGAAVEASA